MSHRAGQSMSSSHSLVNLNPSSTDGLTTAFQAAHPFAAHGQFPPANDQQQIIRLLMAISEGQTKISSRLDQLESKVDELQKYIPRKLSKVSVELQKISHRTGYIKDISTNMAAHTLNTARKVHGAKSVLDPVKQFRKDGHKNWTIHPEPPTSAPFNPFPTPMMPFDSQRRAPVLQNIPYPQQVNISSGLVPKNSVEADSSNGGSRTPQFEMRTPVYENESNELHFEGCQGKPRFQPYQAKSTTKTAGRSATRATSPYVPGTPNYT